jgi:hypothetical protein
MLRGAFSLPTVLPPPSNDILSLYLKNIDIDNKIDDHGENH